MISSKQQANFIKDKLISLQKLKSTMEMKLH